MKIILILLFFLICNNCFGQMPDSVDTTVTSHFKIDDNLTRDTRKIMIFFHFPIRPNVRKDHQLSIKVDTNYTNHHLTASFLTGADSMIVGDRRNANRYYLSPMIILSKNTDDIILHNTQTSQAVFVETYVTIIHELTHYYQSAGLPLNYYFPSDTIRTDLRKYMTQENEFEAYAVSDYYGMQKLYNNDLKAILNMKVPRRRQAELIIDFWQEKLRWWWRPIFSN